MTDYGYTNWIQLHRELGLDPKRHGLFVVDYYNQPVHQSQIEQFETVFLLSGEGNTRRYVDPERPNWHYFDSIVADADHKQHLWMFHFYHTIRINRALHLTNEIQSYQQRPLLWEALLGLQRPHRDVAYHRIQANKPLLDKTFLNYYGLTKQYIPGYRGESDPVDIKWSSGTIDIGDVKNVWRSQILPADIYNQTWFSLVCETKCQDHDHSFFTEKVAKPMLAGRPFVILSNQHYLKRLRSLGFKTFASVWDESYDAIEDDQSRWNAAIDLMEHISSLDPVRVYQNCQEILLHNQQLVQTDWFQQMQQNILKILQDASK